MAYELIWAPSAYPVKDINYNLHEICEDLRSKQKDCGHEVVSLPPKRFAKSTGS